MATVSEWPRAERVLIVASGPSVREMDPAVIAAAPVTIIAVNGAIEWLPRADYWCSVDGHRNNLRRLERRLERRRPRTGTIYVLAAPPNITVPAGVVRLQRIAHERYHPSDPHRLDAERRGREGLSEDRSALHSGNSAYGALGLAYHMRPLRVALLGVDGTQEERVEGGRPNDLAHLPRLFSSALPQLCRAGIVVVNGSPESRVDAFKRMQPGKALEWLTR